MDDMIATPHETTYAAKVL